MKNMFIVLYLLYSCLILQANEVQNIYNDLDNLLALPEKVAKVSDFLIAKDVANFHLKEGNLYLLSPVNEQYVAALFKGEGKVIIEPPTKFARERLYSELQVETIDDSFEYLFLIFSKELYNELTQKLSFEKAELEKDIVNHIDHCKLYLFDYRNKELYYPLLKSLLPDVQDGYFYAHIVNKDIKKPLFFEFDPHSTEEVSISVRRKQTTLSDYFHKPICMFHKQEDYQSESDLTLENKDAISINKYKININITPKLEFSATCSYDFTGKENSGKWIEFYIFPKMKIVSVTSQNGDSLSFFKGDEHQFLWIDLEETIKKGKDYYFTVNYEGNVIERGGSIIKINSYYKWYPVFPTYEYNHYDLTFNFPASYDLVSVGEKISEEKIGKMKKSVWQTNHKVNYATFNMGKLKHEEFEHPSIPELSLFLDKNLDNAKADVANSISFYQSVFGDCIYDKITVAGIPDIFMGIAFPGFINFYSDGFIKKALFKVHYDININEIDFVQLRAHEAAHQWWGCAIQPRTYRDIWLAEGLSEFSSIWFIQTSLKNNEDYFNYLLKWKTKIIDEQKMQRKEKKSSPPIWLGRRAPYYIYYQKAGWVFHMLRMLMIDLDTYNEDTFKAMIQDFYKSYQGSTVTTEDFKNIVEKHIKTDMAWFFAQWIYGSEIPKLSFDYSISQKKDGNYLATCKFQQDNVSEDFISHIPIEIDFGNNQKVRRRILVKGNERIMEISLPQKPEKIVFNILDSVLSE